MGHLFIKIRTLREIQLNQAFLESGIYLIKRQTIRLLTRSSNILNSFYDQL